MKSGISFFAIFFFVIFSGFTAAPSVLSFYTEPSLFPYDNVVKIQQDDRDCLYFGTRSGLIRYNGISAKRYEHIPFDDSTMRSNQIQTMFMDKDDILWVGTYGGLERFDTATEEIIHYPSCSDVISAVFRDSKDRLWVGTLNGLDLYIDEADKTFITFTNQQSNFFIGNNTIRSISEDSRGIIYASTYDGVWEYNELHHSFTRCTVLPEGCPGKNGVVYSFIEDAGTYWAAVWGVGLVHVLPALNTYEVYTFPDNSIYVVYNNFVDTDYIAVGTWGGGIFVLNKLTKQIFCHTAGTGENVLSHGVIYDIFIDKYDMMFVGTGGALNLVDMNHIENQIAAPMSPQNISTGTTDSRFKQNIQCTEITEGIVWAAANNILLKYHIYDESQSQTFMLSSQTVRNASDSILIYTIEAVDNSVLWIGTNEGLFLFDIHQSKFFPIFQYNNAVAHHASLLIRAIYSDKDKTVWIGTYNDGLYRFTPEQGIIKHYRHSDNPFSLINDIIFFIDEDSSGTLWIGTNRGLSRYRRESDDFISYLYDVHKPAGISANRVDSFCEDSEGYLWFGTKDGGVCKFDPKTESFMTYTTANGLSSNQIVGIADTGKGSLWIVTDKDLHLFDTKKETVQLYNIKDIKHFGFFTGQPSSIPRDELFFFGTHRGVVKITQKMFDSFSLQLIPVRIRSVSVNGEKIALYDTSKSFSFNYRDNDFEFQFAAPYSSPLKKTVYAYKLNGFDTKWNIASDRNYANYTNLSPGTYTFSVKNIADPYAVSDTFSFIIRPSAFLSPIMVWLYILIVSFVLFLLYKINKLYWFQRYASVLEEKQLVLIQDNFTLKELSMLDHLTGIGNRRFIDTMGAKLWETSLEHKVPLSILMLDIDFFKRYNDSYGHQAGDDLLRLIGSVLKGRVRTETDLLGRYGGEEFLIVLYNVGQAKALHIAEGIRKMVETMHEKHGDTMAGKVTISIGLFCCCPSESCSFDDMIYRADHALYAAKGSGRNRVVSYSAEDDHNPADKGGN
ncbi:MAG: ligand-binding sensor domain-containing protein [Treponema sp.]